VRRAREVLQGRTACRSIERVETRESDCRIERLVADLLGSDGMCIDELRRRLQIFELQ